MSFSITQRFQRFPYLVIGWGVLAAVAALSPDRLFLTARQGFFLAFAFLGVALVRGARQISDQFPIELGALTLSHLPRKGDMQYIGHGFPWNPERANELVAAERIGALA